MVIVRHSRQLHAAAWRGDIDETKKQLLAGADVNATPPWRKWSPLMFAAASPRASTELLQLLLEGKADPNLISNRFEETASFRFEETALQIAARAGHLHKVQRLVQAGADVRFRDSNGYTVLLGAALNPTLIRYLIDAGADVNSVTPHNESVLSG